MNYTDLLNLMHHEKFLIYLLFLKIRIIKNMTMYVYI